MMVSHRRIVAPMRLLPTKSARTASAEGGTSSIIYVQAFTICSPTSQARCGGPQAECRYALGKQYRRSGRRPRLDRAVRVGRLAQWEARADADIDRLAADHLEQ